MVCFLENAGSTKAAALMQMIIEEIQLRQANYRYTVSTLAFNLVLFFDRLDNENIKFQNNSRETSDYTRKIISYIELDTFSMEHFSFASISQAFLIRTRFDILMV